MAGKWPWHGAGRLCGVKGCISAEIAWKDQTQGLMGSYLSVGDRALEVAQRGPFSNSTTKHLVKKPTSLQDLVNDLAMVNWSFCYG